MALINYFGGGAGVAAFATVVSVSSATISPSTVLALLPAFLAAMLAVYHAIMCRRSSPYLSGPIFMEPVIRIDESIKAGVPVETASLNAKYGCAGSWYSHARFNSEELTSKCRYYDKALCWQVASIGLLIVPLVIAWVNKA